MVKKAFALAGISALASLEQVIVKVKKRTK
jgi:hypothetical protein